MKKTTRKIVALFKKGQAEQMQGLSNQSFKFIKNQANETTLYIYDEVGWYGVEAQDFANALSELNGEPLTVRISSNGGSVSDGIAIYNMLRDYSGQVTTINDSIAASIASIIFMAGTVRKCAKTASFMTHKPMSSFYGNSDELVAFNAMLEHFNEVLVKAYIQGGVEEGKSRELINSGNNWFMCDEAVEIGFATEESDAPAMAASVDLTMFDNVPETVLNATLERKVNLKTPEVLQNKTTGIEDVEMSNEEELLTKGEQLAAVAAAQSQGFKQALSRRSDVLALDSANGRDKLANSLMANVKLSIEEIDAFLQDSPNPAETQGLNSGDLNDNLGELGDGGENCDGQETDRVEAFAATIGKSLK